MCVKFLHVSPIVNFLICSEDAFRRSEAAGVLAVLPSGNGLRVQDPGRGSLDA